MTSRHKRRLNRRYRKARRMTADYPHLHRVYWGHLNFEDDLRTMGEVTAWLDKVFANFNQAMAPRSVLHNGKARRR